MTGHLHQGCVACGQSGESAPKVAVALPVHNQFAYLEASVASILGQTFTDFELVIGCDGSDDGSRELLDRLARSDSRIRLLRRASKSGLAASVNWVVRETHAPFVAIAHGDDISHPERLERQLALLRASPGAAAVGSVAEGIDPSGRRVQPPNLWSLVRRSPFAPFAHSSVMFRRAAFDQVGGYRRECDRWEDLDLWWRLAETGRILVVTTPLVQYRHSPDSSRGRDAAAEVEQALERMYRAADLRWPGRDLHSARPAALARRDSGKLVRPRIFIARSWMPLWCGKRPGIFRRMLKRAYLGPDGSSLEALMFVGWATISPKSLRLVLKTFLRARNWLVRRDIGDVGHVDWQPRPQRRPPQRDLADVSGAVAASSSG